MTFLIDHPQLVGGLLQVVVIVAGFVAAWTTMRFKLEAVMKSITKLEGDLVGDLAACKTEHDACRQSVMAHHENSFLHITSQERELTKEWRGELTERLKRIENMVADMHRKNGGAR